MNELNTVCKNIIKFTFATTAFNHISKYDAHKKASFNIVFIEH